MQRSAFKIKLSIIVILPLLVICFSVIKTVACLQAAGRSEIGERIKVDGISAPEFIKNLTSHKDQAYWQKVRDDIEKQKTVYFGIESKNNLAVALIHLGQVKEAITILEELEKERPGEYLVAANLGTAFELKGENRKALEWIKEGVKRKPESHFGTEWLHVKILETKIAMQQDPEWLNEHSVIETNFGKTENQAASDIFTTDHLGQKKSLAEIEEALIYQLHERLEFVKPPEPVVADLLGDLSKTFVILRTSEHAKAVNDLSVNYGAKPKEMPKSASSANNNPSLNYAFYGILGVIITLTLIGIFAFIKKRL